MQEMITKEIKLEKSPTLQTVLMVEKFIDKHSGEYGKTNLFNSLPRKMVWPTFQVIIEYLQSIKKIVIDNDGKVVYIWNPEFSKKIEGRPAIKL